ncbi:MAG TPA: ATP-binding protein [Clostridiaceae bacterium]|nr:ATP-binding protein [Clostridiaceae bacterium]
MINDDILKQTLRENYAKRRNVAQQRGAEREAATLADYPELAQLEQNVAAAGAELALAALGESNDQETPSQNYQTKQNELRLAEAARKEFLDNHNIPESYHQPMWTCTDCQDTGFVNGKPCHCLEQAYTPLLHKYLNLDLLEGMTFADFDLSIFEDDPATEGGSVRQRMSRLEDIMAKYTRDFVPGVSDDLLFIGPPGTGKTFLAGCIANALTDRDIRVLYISAIELFRRLSILRKLEAAFMPDPEAKKEAEQFYNLLQTIPLLIIDDLGTEEVPAGIRLSELLQIINVRSRGQTSTLISSNLSPRELTEMYDERLVSRLYGNFKVIQFKGRDIRLRRGHGS